LYYYTLEFARHAQIFSAQSAPDSDIPRAKDAKVAKMEIYFFCSFAPFACFARDIPSFGCGGAALGPLWLILFSDSE